MHDFTIPEASRRGKPGIGPWSLRTALAAATVMSLGMGGSACRSAPGGQSPSATSYSTAVPFSVLYESDGGVRHALRGVVDTREEFERLWREMHAGTTPIPEVPTVDFTREMVIVAAMGFQAGVGSKIVITGVRDQGNVLDITVEVRPLPVGCPGYPTVTYPTVMVRAPAKRATPVFHDRVMETPC